MRPFTSKPEHDQEKEEIKQEEQGGKEKRAHPVLHASAPSVHVIVVLEAVLDDVARAQLELGLHAAVRRRARHVAGPLVRVLRVNEPPGIVHWVDLQIDMDAIRCGPSDLLRVIWRCRRRGSLKHN